MCGEDVGAWRGCGCVQGMWVCAGDVGVCRGCGCVQGVKLIVVREGQGKVEVKL